LAEARYEITVDAFDDEDELILTGVNFANVFVGEVTYAQIALSFTSGELDIAVILPGEDLIANLEISGVVLDDSEEITVVLGPGIFIERLLGGSGTYIPGPASMKVFSIETSGNNVVTLQSWFDGLQEPRSGSLIVNDLTGSESYRWNMFEMTPQFYQVGSVDQTQFYFSILNYEAEEFVAGLGANYDPSGDKGIEIAGITPADMAAKVRDDVSNNTVTLTFGYEAGLRELYLWMLNFVDGIADIRSMSVITYGAGGFGDEVSRRNYFEVFPLSFEQINGFQSDVKGQFRVVLSYDFSEDA
jgi:hypothetical protein